MTAKDHGRVYFTSLKGSAKQFETEHQCVKYLKEKEGMFYPVKGIDYYFFSDVEEDRDEKGCRKIVS